MFLDGLDVFRCVLLWFGVVLKWFGVFPRSPKNDKRV